MPGQVLTLHISVRQGPTVRPGSPTITRGERGKAPMVGPMLLLGGVGILLLFTAPLLARLAVGEAGDPVGLKRIFWVVAGVLLLCALLVRPHSDATAVFPPPPDEVEGTAR